MNSQQVREVGAAHNHQTEGGGTETGISLDADDHIHDHDVESGPNECDNYDQGSRWRERTRWWCWRQPWFSLQSMWG